MRSSFRWAVPKSVKYVHLTREVSGISDLINDHIEVFCGGGCLKLLHTQHGGHSIGKESVHCRYRGGNAENKHQRQLTYVVPGKTFLLSIIKFGCTVLHVEDQLSVPFPDNNFSNHCIERLSW